MPAPVPKRKARHAGNAGGRPCHQVLRFSPLGRYHSVSVQMSPEMPRETAMINAGHAHITQAPNGFPAPAGFRVRPEPAGAGKRGSEPPSPLRHVALFYRHDICSHEALTESKALTQGDHMETADIARGQCTAGAPFFDPAVPQDRNTALHPSREANMADRFKKPLPLTANGCIEPGFFPTFTMDNLTLPLLLMLPQRTDVISNGHRLASPVTMRPTTLAGDTQ